MCNNCLGRDSITFTYTDGWKNTHGWYIFSKVVSGGFCKVCALFTKNRAKLGVLVNKPFMTWVKVHNTLDSHASNSNYVQYAVKNALDFQCSVEELQLNINVRIKTKLLHCITGTLIVKCCAESILHCC